MVDYKASKKAFANTIRLLARNYENEEICNAVRMAEVNRNSFWRLVKRCRNTEGTTNIAIKKDDGSVVNDVGAALDVWRTHFANLDTPKNKDNFNEEHYHVVTEFVRLQNEGRTVNDEFF